MTATPPGGEGAAAAKATPVSDAAWKCLQGAYDLQVHVAGKNPEDFIFSHEDGSPFGQNCMFRAWRKACKEAKVKYIPLQQASRHSMASQIMADHKKKAIEEIQNRLGHFNKQTQKAYVLE
jgi:integrase